MNNLIDQVSKEVKTKISKINTANLVKNSWSCKKESQ
jgi:hypothetical protein